MSGFWSGRRVIVTGGAGFLGSHLVPRLEEAGASVFVPRSAAYDLRTPAGVEAMFADAGRPDVLFHLAANVGGIGANRAAPADILRDNLLMNTLLVDAAHRHEAGKIVAAGSVCAYPKWTPVPFTEANLFAGEPEETNAAYGESKRALLVHLQAMRQQHGTNGVYLLLTNLYGPGMDFDPHTSHAAAALIRKFSQARETGAPSVTLWGTGRPTRDLLFVADAAQALMLAAEWYNGSEPVNVGSGRELMLFGLAEMVKNLVGYEGGIEWDRSKPDGQPRRALNTRRAWDAFGWRAETELEDGLRDTLEWWQRCKA